MALQLSTCGLGQVQLLLYQCLLILQQHLAIALPNRDDKIDSTHDHFGQDLHQHVRGIQRNDFQFDGFKSSMASCNSAPAAVLCDKTGGIHSQPCKLLSFNYLIISENLILVRLLQSTTQQ